MLRSFFLNSSATPDIYTLSLHDALPILPPGQLLQRGDVHGEVGRPVGKRHPAGDRGPGVDRKSTRLNSSHGSISYAVFCLKKKKQKLAMICHDELYTSITLQCGSN